MFIVVGVLCRISYSVINYSHISFSGLITSVGEERANCSIYYLLLCDFCSEGFPFPLGVKGVGCLILLWHSLGLP